MPSSATLKISIGLNNTHYYIAGCKSFEQVVYGNINGQTEGGRENPFLVSEEREDSTEREDSQDPQTEEQGQANVAEPSLALLVKQEIREPTIEELHPIYPVEVANASPGGYCLEWSMELPQGIQSGDIVSVHEGANKDWDIAVLRWISHLDNNKTLIGIELLSPSAVPYGARIHSITGREVELMRVLLLPEIKLVGQAHTLITPRSRFREHQKVTLIRQGEEFFIQLQRQISATVSYAQFDFQYITHLEEVATPGKGRPPKPAYESLWSNI